MKIIWVVKCKKCNDEIERGFCKCGNVGVRKKGNQILALFCDDLTTCNLKQIVKNKNLIIKEKSWFPFSFAKVEKINMELDYE